MCCKQGGPGAVASSTPDQGSTSTGGFIGHKTKIPLEIEIHVLCVHAHSCTCKAEFINSDMFTALSDKLISKFDKP